MLHKSKQKEKEICNNNDEFFFKLSQDSFILSLNNGRVFWTETLKSARHILAPMVDQSELAFRLLVRQYDVHCTYSPMFNASIFLKESKYQKDCLQVLPELDRPLIIQFCANNPETFLEAAKIAERYCNAIDLNLGCPQTIAKRGHYGAFLQDDWNLIYNIINLAAKKLSVPVTCKIRVFNDVEKTIKYAKMIESAGASLITVHGRVREQKGPLTGLADWNQIRRVKENVKIPVFANGNIQSKIEVENCFKETNVDGVMSAEGLLYNPSLFTNKPLAVWDATRQYIELSRKYPCPFSYIRGHVFKFFHSLFMLEEHKELRNIVAKTRSDEDFLMVATKLETKYRDDYNKFIDANNIPTHPNELPIFFCKPYYRPPPTKFNTNLQSLTNIPNKLLDETKLNETHKPIKRIKLESKPKIKTQRLPLCKNCPNPKGIRCNFGFCRTCCRTKTLEDKLNCIGHRFKVSVI